MKYFLSFLMVLAYTSEMVAQTPSDPSVKQYYQCFDRSTRSQFTKNIAAEPNMVAETAFQACSTEEQIILTRLSLATVPLNQAWAIILRHRAVLKRKITG